MAADDVDNMDTLPLIDDEPEFDDEFHDCGTWSEDDEGNIYYQEKGGRKRWVIYNPENGDIEASRVSADWHGWLHYTTDALPSEEPLVRKDWEIDHIANQTGGDGAYSPLAAGVRATTTGDYEAWRPE